MEDATPVISRIIVFDSDVDYGSITGIPVVSNIANRVEK